MNKSLVMGLVFPFISCSYAQVEKEDFYNQGCG